MSARPDVKDLLWSSYVWPKGRLGNGLQGAVIGGLESKRVRREWDRADRVLLVHTPGKVGSMAIFTALVDTRRPGDAVFHTHRINPDNLVGVEWERKGLAPRRTWYTADFLGRRLRQPHDKEVVVLAAVRDPVERSLSAFLQNAERYSDAGRPITAGSRVDADDLTRQFVRYLYEQASSRWFEVELEAMFGIDVLGLPFDHGLGYQIAGRDRLQVGVIRHDRFGDALTPFLAALTGLPEASVGRVNDSTAKPYAAVHRTMRESMRLPHSLVEAHYASAQARHFFTEEERETAVRRWSCSPRLLTEVGAPAVSVQVEVGARD